MHLPQLAFGNASSSLMTGEAEVNDAMQSVVPSLLIIPDGSSRAMHAKVALRQVGGIKLVANASGASRLEVEDSQGWHLIVPSFGPAEMKCEGRKFAFAPGAHALLLPNFRRTTSTQLRSGVSASMDIARLTQVSAAMLGDEDPGRSTFDEAVHKFRISSNPGLYRAFHQICQLIDNLDGHDHLGGIFGLEDMIYRWVATAATSPEAALADPPRLALKNGRLDDLCDVIRARCEQPMTLTEMEYFTSLSARSLQYAFKVRFGCTPMEWQRRERMLEARMRLKAGSSDATITDIAYAMGFASSAAFTTLYKRYFDETPSQTIATL